MKCTFFLILISISMSVIGQKAFNWINFPTIDGISYFEEALVREALLVEDRVKQITCTSYFIGDEDKEIVNITYSESGMVMSIRTTSYDPQSVNGISSMSFVQFEYDQLNKLSSESLLTLIEGDTIERIEKRFPCWFPHQPEPIARDIEGNITQISLAGDPTDIFGIVTGILRDTTYSFYDEFNRKIMDSIPSSSDDNGTKIIYRYDGNIIHRECYFIDYPEAPSQKYVYTVDTRGNWIELKYYGSFDIDNAFLTQLYTREIVYY